MYAYIAKAAGIVLAMLALVFGCWKGVDYVASAFRDRTTLTAKLTAADHANAATAKQLADNNRQFETQLSNLQTDLAARERAAVEDRNRADKIQKELDNANTRMQAWRKGASAQLRACLDMPVPDGIDGSVSNGKRKAVPATGAGDATGAGKTAAAGGKHD